jgi:hypothetical protein
MSALANGMWLALFGPLVLLPMMIRRFEARRVTATSANKETK